MSRLCSLAELSFSGSEDVRDVYTEGLKTVLGHVPINFGDQVAAKLIPPLLDGLADKVNIPTLPHRCRLDELFYFSFTEIV